MAKVMVRKGPWFFWGLKKGWVVRKFESWPLEKEAETVGS
jgi:hypothetical protein